MNRLNVYFAREYTHNGEKRTDWMRVGVAFPHREGGGFNIQLHAVPVGDGKLVALPHEPKDTDTPPAE